MYWITEVTLVDKPYIHNKFWSVDETKTYPNSLSNSLVTLLQAGPSFCDFTIVCGNQGFRCHKQILASRSSAFAAMLSGKGFHESISCSLNLKDTSPSVAKSLLSCIYGGKVELKSLWSLLPLLLLAHKYGVEISSLEWEEALHRGLDRGVWEDNDTVFVAWMALFHGR